MYWYYKYSLALVAVLILLLDPAEAFRLAADAANRGDGLIAPEAFDQGRFVVAQQAQRTLKLRHQSRNPGRDQMLLPVVMGVAVEMERMD